MTLCCLVIKLLDQLNQVAKLLQCTKNTSNILPSPCWSLGSKLRCLNVTITKWNEYNMLIKP